MHNDFIWIVGGRLFLALFSLLSIRCISYFLSPMEYGELATIIAIQTFCGFFIVNPLCQHLNRFTHQWWNDKTLLPRLKSFSNYILLAAVVGAIVCIFVKHFSNSSQVIMTAISVFTMVLTSSWNGALVYLLNMLGFRQSAVAWGTVTVICSLVCSILLFLQFGSVLAWYIGQAIGMMIGAIGAIHRIYDKSEIKYRNIKKLPFLDWNSIRFYCLPLAIATGFMWLQWNGWRFLVEYYWNLNLLGYMVMGGTIAVQVWALFESLAMQFLFPLFFHRIAYGNQESNAFSDVLNTLGPIYLVLTGATVLISPQLLAILAGSQYSTAIFFLVCAILIEACRVLANLFALAIQVTRKSFVLSVPFIIGSFCVLSSVSLIGEMHIDVYLATISMVVSAFVMLVIMIFLMYRQLVFSLDVRRWLLGVLICLVFIVCNELWEFPVSGIISFVYLFIVGLVCICSFFLLLWKNPALERLLAVRLKEGGLLS